MSFRIRSAFAVTLLLSLAFAVPAFAGGWAVITLDELPTNVVAGEPVTIGFTVLQHGMTPLNDLDPTIKVHLDKSNDFVIHAKHDNKPGHYTAEMTLPKAGTWEWSIEAFAMDQRMPDLIVAAPVGAIVSEPAVETQPAAPVMSSVWMIRASAVALCAAGTVMAFQRKSRWAVALVVIGLGVGLVSLRMGPAVPEVEAESESVVEAESGLSLSDAEFGAQLFVAKGCVTCHVNRKVENSYDYWTIDMGAPDLTNFSASPEVLRIRLKDPSAAKSDTKMPNLGLKEYEIEALIAFINAK